MSKVEVDAIVPQSGTTITLGDSGDSIDITSGATVTNFTSTGIDDNATSTAVTIDSSENVGIGTSSPVTLKSSTTLQVNGNAKLGDDNGRGLLSLGDIASSGANVGIWRGADGAYAGTGNYLNLGGYDGITFTTGNTDIASQTERMRIDSSGHLLVGKTDSSFDVAGAVIRSSGVTITRSSADPLALNRLSNDGTIVVFAQDGTVEGNISVSGSTVSYNGFTGTHWSRLSDNSKPTILKGTILESLDEMMDWYQVQFDITKTDDEGNETTITHKESYALGDGESVGDVITYNFEGTDYQATIIQEGDVKHTKSKISDTVDAKNVYGVFMDWDNDDDTVNDMYVAQTGTFVVRINGSETVSKGDLIQSNGDGTGKVQADDLLRASTVAKVLSTTKIETYEDGSYIVPCSLHC